MRFNSRKMPMTGTSWSAARRMYTVSKEKKTTKWHKSIGMTPLVVSVPWCKQHTTATTSAAEYLDSQNITTRKNNIIVRTVCKASLFQWVEYLLGFKTGRRKNSDSKEDGAILAASYSSWSAAVTHSVLTGRFFCQDTNKKEETKERRLLLLVLSSVRL